MSLGDAIERFLNIYEFDSSATLFALEHMAGQILTVGDSGAYVTKQERILALRQAYEASRDEILKKTLVHIPQNNEGMEFLSEDLATEGYDDQAWVLESKRMRDMIYRVLSDYGTTLTFEQEMELDQTLESHDRDVRAKQLQELKVPNLETALARWFAGNLETATNAISQMDSTDFSAIIPKVLTQAFRECHVNAALGNNGTTMILCGVILERALKDLLAETEDLDLVVLIENAKNDHLLVGRYYEMADWIRKKRNDAAHKKTFCEVTSDEAWEVLVSTRKLVVHLYRGRTR